jgi:hypothetical protein
VTYVVLRSGPADLGQWRTERRNIQEDYEEIFGEKPENPGGTSIAINTNDTHSMAEAFVGGIAFTKP